MKMMMMKDNGVEGKISHKIPRTRGKGEVALITVSQGRKDQSEYIVRQDMVDEEGARASDGSNHQKDIDTQKVDCICFVSKDFQPYTYASVEC